MGIRPFGLVDAHWRWEVFFMFLPIRSTIGAGSALALFVAQVVADHHDPPVTADHLALLADLFDARLNLHVRPICVVVHRV
jgi:hypothetical protein